MATDKLTCSFAGCDRLRTSKGLCKSHRRHERSGKPLAPLRSYTPKACAHDSCVNRATARGYCQTHARQIRNGKPLADLMPRAKASGFPCLVDGCGLVRRARGLCVNHYAQARRGTIAFPVIAQERRTPPTVGTRSVRRGCTFDECNNPHDSRGLCSTHNKQALNGKPLTAIKTIRPGVWSSWRVQPTGYVARWRSVNGVREYCLQHRHVMESHLGRKLLRNESVHHINGDRADNRLHNLELWNTSQPSGQRAEDKVAWAREILSLYGEPDAPAY